MLAFEQNRAEGTFVEEVEVKWSRWYGGPLAAAFDGYVKINGYMFWEMHMMA